MVATVLTLLANRSILSRRYGLHPSSGPPVAGGIVHSGLPHPGRHYWLFVADPADTPKLARLRFCDRLEMGLRLG